MDILLWFLDFFGDFDLTFISSIIGEEVEGM